MDKAIIMEFSNKYIFGILGLLLIIVDVTINYNRGGFNVGTIDKLVLPTGISLILVGIIPTRIKILLTDYSLSTSVDKIVSRYGILLLCGLVLTGFCLRVINLGNLSFWADELATVYAAIGYLKYGEPVLPSGTEYTRAIFNTILIALSFKIFGISEFSARLVSVIFGTLTILLVYFFGVELVNKRVGLLAAILITLSIWEITWSREARMYTQFQFFYILTAYLFYVGLNRNDIRILLLSAISFLGSFFLHKLSLFFLLVMFVYILITRRFYSKIFVYAIPLFSLFFLFLVEAGYIHLNINYFFPISPEWGRKPFYFYFFLADIAVLLYLVMIGLVISIILKILKLKFETGMNSYILLNFFVPLFVLSLNSWKSPRYVFFIFPFLILLASSVIDVFVFRNVVNSNLTRELSKKFRISVESLSNIKLVTLLIIFLLISVHILSAAEIFVIYQKDHGVVYNIIHSNWRKGCDYVKQFYDEDDKIITTLPLATLYYLGKSDYFLRQFEYKTVMSDGQLTERYAGSTILNTYESFIQVVNSSKGWVIADFRLYLYFTDPQVRSYIKNNMTFHPEGSDDTIEVYSWGKKS